MPMNKKLIIPAALLICIATGGGYFAWQYNKSVAEKKEYEQKWGVTFGSLEEYKKVSGDVERLSVPKERLQEFISIGETKWSEMVKSKNQELGIDLSKRNNAPYPFCAGAELKSWNDCIGVKTFDTGVVFTGEFHNGKNIGRGEYAFPDGGKFVGEVNGVPNGHGVQTNADGSTFEGEFKDGQRHGFGIVKDPQGKEIWAGKWDMGARDIMSKRETINQAMSIEQIASCSAAYAVASKYSNKLEAYQTAINKAKQNLVEMGHGQIVQQIYASSFSGASSSAQYGISLVESCNKKLDKIFANWQ